MKKVELYLIGVLAASCGFMFSCSTPGLMVSRKPDSLEIKIDGNISDWDGSEFKYDKATELANSPLMGGE